MAEGVCLQCGAEIPYDWAPCPECGWKAPENWDAKEEAEEESETRSPGVLSSPRKWIAITVWLTLLAILIIFLCR